MKLNSLAISGLLLSFFTFDVAMAARPDQDPCDQYGALKGWAKKSYDESYCTPPAPSNSAPSVQITSPGDQSEFTTDQPINFTASAYDQEDGDLSPVVTWYSSIDGAITSNVILSPGNHTITASVSDSGSLTAQDSVSLTVFEPQIINSAPVVIIDSPASGYSAEVGTSFLFKAHADDAEDGDLSSKVSWFSSLDGEIGNFTTLSVGDHIITASVTDSAGAFASDVINLSVLEAATPQTYSLAIDWLAPTDRSDGSYLAPEEIAGFQIHWNNDSNGTSGMVTVADGSSTHYQLDELEAGNYRFSLNAIDTEGRSSSDSSTVSIELN